MTSHFFLQHLYRSHGHQLWSSWWKECSYATMPAPRSVETLSDDGCEDPPTLAAVNRLSDDECAAPPVGQSRSSRQAKRKSLQEGRDLAAATQRLRVVVNSNCKCKSVECRQPFRDSHEFKKLLELRMRIWNMDTHAANQEAGWLVLFLNK